MRRPRGASAAAARGGLAALTWTAEPSFTNLGGFAASVRNTDAGFAHCPLQKYRSPIDSGDEATILATITFWSGEPLPPSAL